MASRYEDNQFQKLNDGRQVYRSRIYPNIPLSDNDIYIVTQQGDRLDSLAHQFYSDSSLWWIIATANNVHDASLSVPDGTTLRVPINYTSIVDNFRKQ
jgi:LysM repeat protein